MLGHNVCFLTHSKRHTENMSEYGQFYPNLSFDGLSMLI